MAIFNYKLALRAANSILHQRPVAASLFLTNRCNYQCDFCQYPQFNNDKHQELDAAALERIAHKLADAGVVMVAMIGGEPFVRKDIFDVVRAMSRYLMVQITTNGWFVNEDTARRIFAAGVYMVSVSLDSSDPEVHNTGRRNPRAFERAIRAVECLRDAPKIARDQLVSFESILSSRNAAQVEDMVRLARKLGVNIVFQPFSAGHVDGTVDNIETIDADMTALFQKLKRQYPNLYNNDHMIERLTPFFRDGRIPNCQAGKTIFNVDCYGHITRCEEQRKRYGDLKTLDAAGIDAALAHIRDDTARDGCDTCYLRTRGETEPLYQDDFEHFLRAVQDMFGVTLPRALPRLLALPGMTRVLEKTLATLAPVLDRKPSPTTAADNRG